MKPNLFRQTNAYAMQLGAFFGLYWIVGFVCLVAGFKSPMLHTLYLLILVSSPFFGFYLARRFEQQVREDAPVTFGRAYIFSLLMYLYATILIAGISYIYFRLFDNGYFIESNIAYLHRSEVEQFFNDSQIRSQINELLTQTGYSSIDELMRSITPILITANIVDISLMIGLVLSIPTALVSFTRNKHV